MRVRSYQIVKLSSKRVILKRTSSRHFPNVTKNLLHLYKDLIRSKLYCVCRQPYNANKRMIGCDVCYDWFHYNCVMITMAEAKREMCYICPNCQSSSRERTVPAEEFTSQRDKFGGTADDPTHSSRGEFWKRRNPIRKDCGGVRRNRLSLLKTVPLSLNKTIMKSFNQLIFFFPELTSEKIAEKDTEREEKAETFKALMTRYSATRDRKRSLSDELIRFSQICNLNEEKEIQKVKNGPIWTEKKSKKGFECPSCGAKIERQNFAGHLNECVEEIGSDERSEEKNYSDRLSDLGGRTRIDEFEWMGRFDVKYSDLLTEIIKMRERLKGKMESELGDVKMGLDYIEDIMKRPERLDDEMTLRGTLKEIKNEIKRSFLKRIANYERNAARTEPPVERPKSILEREGYTLVEKTSHCRINNTQFAMKKIMPVRTVLKGRKNGKNEPTGPLGHPKNAGRKGYAFKVDRDRKSISIMNINRSRGEKRKDEETIK